MSFRLIPFSPLDGKKEWELIQAIGEGENGFLNDGYGIPFEDFGEYIMRNIEMSNNINLKSQHFVGCFKTASMPFWKLQQIRRTHRFPYNMSSHLFRASPN